MRNQTVWNRMISELVTIILFRQHLKRNESSCGKQTLILENLPDELVPLLLQYIYLGWVEVSTSYHKIPIYRLNH